MHCLRFKAGWTYTRIAKDQNLSISAVWSICQGKETSKKKKGRPVKFTTPIRCQLVEAATKNAENRRKPLIQIAREEGIHVHEDTLRTIFCKQGYGHFVARRKPYLEP